jgi:hypothetical protein
MVNYKSMPNIIEEYINQKKQMVILLIGPQGSQKSKFSKMLNEDIGFKLIKISDYHNNKYIKKTINNSIFNVYEDIENYEWEKLSNDVDKYKSKGIILYGNNIDTEKITFKIDFIYFTSIKYQLYKKYILKYDTIDNKKEYYLNTYVSNYISPLYENLKSKLKINKFFNIKEDINIDDTYKELFDNLITNIKKIINSH